MSQEMEDVNAKLVNEEEAKNIEPAKAKPIALSEERTIAPTDSSELVRTLSLLHKGGGIPQIFDTAAKQVSGYNLSRALMGENWQLAINNMAPIRGKMAIYNELPRALAERTKEVEEFELFVIDREYNKICVQNKNLNAEPWAGVCVVRRKGRVTKEYSYTVEEAKNAGQLPAKEDSPWNKHRKIMLMRKAQAMGVKFEFPDALVGASIAEYDYDEAPDLTAIRNVTPTVIDKGALLNEKFKRPLQAVAPEVAGEKL